MGQDVDEHFYERADAHINLSNEQLAAVERGRVSASMMFATARFNAWLTSIGMESGAELAAAREKTVDYFVTQFKAMLEDNLDDYAENFQKYMAGRVRKG